jgi:two-component system sensor histidine kinase KdpD
LSIAGAAVLHSTAFVLVFPLAVLLATVRLGIGPAVLTAVVGVLVFDFMFVPPALAFAVPGLKDGLTLAVMIAAAGLASILAEQLRRQVAAARRQAEVEHVRNALLSAMSHDLRAPLTVLVGASTALYEQVLDADQRHDFARMVAEEARRLNRLVGNLLDLTRLEAGRPKVTHSAQAIDEVIGSALDHLERALEGRKVDTRLAEDVPLAFFDPVLLEEVVINLVENAVRHAGPSSPIEVSAWAEDEAIVVEVADHGPGVPAGHEERVFEKFYRAPGAQGDGGIGLGLTICRAILAAHDGKIWMTNRAGGGAVVTFSLPVCSAARALSLPSERVMTEALRS